MKGSQSVVPLLSTGMLWKPCNRSWKLCLCKIPPHCHSCPCHFPPPEKYFKEASAAALTVDKPGVSLCLINLLSTWSATPGEAQENLPNVELNV